MKPHVKHHRRIYQQRLSDGLLKAADTCEKCQRSCDEVKQLQLHHKVPIKSVPIDSDFDPNTQDNLATLCNSCHKGYHVSYEDMPYDEWLETIPVEVVWEKLRIYREQKDATRKFHRLKHLKNR
jgi:5-methylcytosine-specific restriction endonuclease McrA